MRGPWVAIAVIIGAAVVIAGCDALLSRSLPYALQGMLDEIAHLCTGLLVVLALPRRPGRRFALGCLAASVLIDLDHVPLVLRISALTPHAHRPYTHSLFTVLFVLLLGQALGPRWRTLITGVGVGLLLHFVRDAATNYLPLWWPVSNREVAMPYTVYALLIVLLVLLGAVGTFRYRRSVAPSSAKMEHDHAEHRTGARSA